MMKHIDRYILRKFLTTFFFSIILIISVAVVFDLTEKMEDFINKKVPFKTVLLGYYVHFVPFFANLFSPLFTFISVIFFTSRMAFNTEIIAILTNGVSFRRMMLPYFLGALVIASLSWTLNQFVIPYSNAKRYEFEERYIRQRFRLSDTDIHLQLKPGIFVYVRDFNNYDNIGTDFTLEHFEGGILKKKLSAVTARYDSASASWKLDHYLLRSLDTLGESIVSGHSMDTLIPLKPVDFGRRMQNIETMDRAELNYHIKNEKLKGSEQVPFYEVEKHRRTSMPFSTFILTLIGVSIASRKVRGGIGLHIGLGLLMSFAYILFLQVTSTFATNGNLNPLIAVWIPNVLFGIIALILFRTAPK